MEQVLYQVIEKPLSVKDTQKESAKQTCQINYVVSTTSV